MKTALVAAGAVIGATAAVCLIAVTGTVLALLWFDHRVKPARPGQIH